MRSTTERMDNSIYKYNTNVASGERVKAGRYLVGPSGQLVCARLDAPVKSGWRLATQGDIDAAAAIEAENAERGKAEQEAADAIARAESEARDAK